VPTASLVAATAFGLKKKSWSITDHRQEDIVFHLALLPLVGEMLLLAKRRQKKVNGIVVRVN
jgi:hypothetical protein